jgi:hypothetical protein
MGLGVSLPEDGNRAHFRNIVFLKILGYEKGPKKEILLELK